MPNRGGDSKQGLIISVVFLSILVIVLGVTTYLGYHGQKQLVEDAGKANEAAAAAKKGMDWEKFKARQLAAFIGVITPEDLQDLSKLRADYDKGEFKDPDRPAFDGALKKLSDPEAGPGWDAAMKKPLNPLLNQVAALTAELKNQRALYEKAERENKATLDEMNQRLAAADNSIRSYQSQLSATAKQAADVREEKGKAFNDMTELARRSEEEKVDAQKAAQAELQAKDKQIAAQQHDNKELQRGNDKLRAQVAPVDVTKFELAKGKIITSENGFVYINLGQADNVRPNLTFSVYRFSPDNHAQGERKAAIEVVQVVGPHVSSARVTEIRDQGRDPIMVGDLIFNPVWSPSLRDHVAIAGLIDLNGDGRDNTLDFVHALQQQGITVDAYLDLRDLAIKGNGMNMQTNYLIVGENPDVAADLQGGSKGNSNTERKTTILELMSKMQTQADQLGIQKLGARRFMTLIGYKVARRPAHADYDARPPQVGAIDNTAPDTSSVDRTPDDKGSKTKGKKPTPPAQKPADDNGGGPDK